MNRDNAPAPFHLRLPATSANLGPGFDAVALALTLYLDVDAEAAADFSIAATGRNPEVCGALENNLLLRTYAEVLQARGSAVTPLALRVHNEIPLGMGCGSSAAVILAGVALAAHFGRIGWSPDEMLAEACVREGHPDNAAACWLGGFAVAAMDGQGNPVGEGPRVHALSIAPKTNWKLMLALPANPLATKAARALLPDNYSRADTVFNLQRVALLTAAFAEGRGDLLHAAMQDRMHQPYRAEVCPLLGRLAPLAGTFGILGVALSGAGPAVLLILEEQASMTKVREEVARALQDTASAEVLLCDISNHFAAGSVLRHQSSPALVTHSPVTKK